MEADDHSPHAAVGDQALTRLRRDILSGRLAPGQKLTLDRLKEPYRAGLGALREALSLLAGEGLVIAEAARGFYVAPVSAAEMKDLGELRFVLESHALGRSFAQGDVDWEAGVLAARHKLAAMEKRLIAGESVDQSVWKGLDVAFHQALISACGSPSLMDAHRRIFEKYMRYQMIAMRFRGAGAAAEHEALAEAAMRRDADKARAVLERHIAGGVAVALDSAPFR